MSGQNGTGGQNLLLFGGMIHPLKREEPGAAVKAVLVQNGRIAALGEPEELRLRCQKGTAEFDLRGGTLLPAFIDAHSHLGSVASNYTRLDLSQVHSPVQLQQAVEAYIRDNGLEKGEWVQGFGYDHTTFPEKAHPTTALLDAAAPDNPVFLSHVSGHAGVLNTAALRAMKEEGEGYREEGAFFELTRKLPMPTPEAFSRALRRAQLMYASHGITTVQEGMLTAQMLPLYRAWTGRDEFFLDVVGYAEYTAAAEFEEAFSDCTDRYLHHFRLGGVKMFLDGSPQNRTAWMREPYLPLPGALGEWRGEPALKPEIVQRVALECARRGRQLLTHANGDAAAGCLLQALQAAADAGADVAATRPVMIHAQLIGRDQLPAAAKLGVYLSFFIAHIWEWGDVHIQNFGMERAADISPAKSALRLGIPFTFHQDSPVLAPDMLHTLRCAVQRRTRSGVVLDEAECLTPAEALLAITGNAAAQYFEEDEKGSLEPGKRADMVLLDRDPLNCPPEELDETAVLRTWKDGLCVYASGETAAE